jgi:hypothetical protein
MALIVGFPDLAAAAKPTVADLNTAVTKIVEQIGGVDGDGTHHAGNLGTANPVAAAFRNAHKAEPHSIFPISLRTVIGAPYSSSCGPLPADITVVGATIACEGGTGATAVLEAAGLTIFVDDVERASLAAAEALERDLYLSLGIGQVVRVEMADVTYRAGGPATEIRVTLWCKALHRE